MSFWYIEVLLGVLVECVNKGDVFNDSEHVIRGFAPPSVDVLEVVRSWDMIDVDLVFVVSEEGAEGRTYGLDSSVTLRSVDKEIKSLVAGISEDVGLGDLSYGLKDLVTGEMI